MLNVQEVEPVPVETQSPELLTFDRSPLSTANS